MPAMDSINLIRESPFLTVNYSTVFEFEKGFDHEEWIVWFEKYWIISVLLSAVYILLVFAGRKWMENKPKYDLRRALTIWSALLAVFSWCGALRLWTDFIFFMKRFNWDFKASMCDPVFYRGVIGYWCWLFVISKLPELGDTIFIVLRKQKLIFLHWYHHITVFVYSWYSYSGYTSTARYFILMNFTVHAFMYTYYALKASRVCRMPSWVSMAITGLQLSQMLVGCLVNIEAYNYKQKGEFCSIGEDNLKFSFIMYFSYLILFGHFFYTNYLVAKKVEPVSEAKKVK